MKKSFRKLRRWLVHYGRIYVTILFVVGLVLAALWYGMRDVDGGEGSDDLGDGSLSDAEEVLFSGDYADALAMFADGNEERGRDVMKRLAPLRQAGNGWQGNADAHLWIARDLLRGRSGGFLKEFPIGVVDGTLLKPVGFELGDEVTELAEQHLRAAIGLKPEIEDATLILAELLILEGKRNAAIKILVAELGRTEGRNFDLGVPLANSLMYAGDDLDLKEVSLYEFSKLGEELVGRNRGDRVARLRYVIYAYVLGREEQGEIGMERFLRDFGSSTEMDVAGLKATGAYFKAVHGLRGDRTGMEEVVDALIEAHGEQPGRKELVEALERVASEFPVFRDKIKVGLGAAKQGFRNVDEEARWHLAMAGMEEVSEHLEKAYALAGVDLEISLAYAERRFEVLDPEDISVLEQRFSQALDAGGLSGANEFRVNLVLGRMRLAKEDWKGALRLLEGALAMRNVAGSGAQRELHALLGGAYREMGQFALAERHREFAQ